MVFMNHHYIVHEKAGVCESLYKDFKWVYIMKCIFF